MLLFNTKLDTTCNLRLLRHVRQPRLTWPRYGNICGKCFSQGHKDALLSSGTELRVDDIAVAKLRSYPLSCTVVLALNAVPKDTTPRYAQYGNRTSNLPITFRRSNRLSYAAALAFVIFPRTQLRNVQLGYIEWLSFQKPILCDSETRLKLDKVWFPQIENPNHAYASE